MRFRRPSDEDVAQIATPVRRADRPGRAVIGFLPMDLPPCRAAPPANALWWWLRANWLYGNLVDGELPEYDGSAEKRRLPVALRRLGVLSFEKGELVAADPYLMADEDIRPVQQHLPRSPYEVLIAVATVGADHDRNAAALLANGTDPIVNWDMARWPGQDPESLGPEEFFGYAVDAGTGCFADVASARATSRVLAEDAGMLNDPLSRALFVDPKAPGAAVTAPAEGARPVGVFTSGWGDGMYPTWLGLNDRQEVVVAITDFLLTSDPFAAPPDAAASVVSPPESAPVARSKQSRWKRLFGRT
jgi:hypothetical protein